jgi:hypothetical protein
MVIAGEMPHWARFAMKEYSSTTAFNGVDATDVLSAAPGSTTSTSSCYARRNAQQPPPLVAHPMPDGKVVQPEDSPGPPDNLPPNTTQRMRMEMQVGDY